MALDMLDVRQGEEKIINWITNLELFAQVPVICFSNAMLNTGYLSNLEVR